jgi:hypothetical protein
VFGCGFYGGGGDDDDDDGDAAWCLGWRCGAVLWVGLVEWNGLGAIDICNLYSTAVLSLVLIVMKMKLRLMPNAVLCDRGCTVYNGGMHFDKEAIQ